MERDSAPKDAAQRELSVFVRLHAAPGREQDVAALIRDVIEATRAEPGNKSIHGFRSVRDPREFHIHSCWHDEAAFDRHAELEHTVRFLRAIDPLLDEARRISRTLPLP